MEESKDVKLFSVEETIEDMIELIKKLTDKLENFTKKI